MKQHRLRAYTLVEVLVVMAMIAVLAALLLPALDRAHKRARGTECLNNLKQIGLAFHVFAHDHNDKFPMQVSTNAGGTLEFVQAGNRLGGGFYFAYRHFQPLSNELGVTKTLLCPVDGRRPATSFAQLKNDNLSYFVGINATMAMPDSVLAGDRNISNRGFGPGSILTAGGSDALDWTAQMHESKGNLLFSDGRVEQLSTAKLRAALGRVPGSMAVLWPPIQSPADFSIASSMGETPGRSAGGSGGGSTAVGGTKNDGSGGRKVGAGGVTGSSGGDLPAKTTAMHVASNDPARSKPPGEILSQAATTRAVRPASSPGSVSPASIGEQPADVPKERVADPASTQALTSRADTPEPPPSEPDNWLGLVADFIGKTGAKATYFVLLVILAILIGMEVIRLRRKRRKAEHA